MEEKYLNMSRRSPGRREAPAQRRSGHREEPPRRSASVRERDSDWDDWGGEPPRRKKSGGDWAVSALMSFYKVLVVLSIIIVAIYVGSKVLIRAPGQEDLTPPPQTNTPSKGQDVSGGSASAAPPAAPSLEQRELVYNIFLAATDKGGSLSDTMMVMSYDIKNQTVGVISIPRDTLVARKSGNPRLVYGKGGLEQRMADVSDMLGIPIHYYIKVNLKGFISLVDYLEGVDINIPCNMDYDDPYQDLHIHYKKGPAHLNGKQAMEVVRFRKNNDGSGYSDVGRTETQQLVLVALAKKVLSWNSITRVNGFVEIFNESVDTNLTLNDMLYFAKEGINLDPSTAVETATLPGRGDGVYRGYNYCYELDPEGTLDLVNRLVNPYTRPLTLEDLNLAKAEKYH
ncbi:LytR family transcriptional regulator [Colidextribacter sp. OB.20]|uniref:LCP family protein n=1 Tax=Colidextribacter sp. OB.20 TaxID=2304568 RepID=UPI001368A5A5|nr:LCP family protein [Colidextribacter sp. OB.20]NBI09312.1 LytR family transcriptional regulator [Colidextribacter sp. OB.20]